MNELEQAAKAAGLMDPDLLKIARPDLSATQALADLRQRYPSAFVKRAIEMAPAERAAAARKLGVRLRGAA